MDTYQREKLSIQKREERIQFILSVLVLTAVLIPIAITSQVYPHLLRTLTNLTACLFSLFFVFCFFFVVILGARILKPFIQKTQQMKQNWLDEYGLSIQAPVTRYLSKDALLVNGSRWQRKSHDLYLSWQDPDTGQLYSFCVSTRFSSARRNLSEGDVYPLQFDPNDLSFFIIPHD